MKKHQSHLNFLTQVGKKKEERWPKDDKEKKIPPLLGMKEEAQSFFDLRRDSKNLTIEKKVKKFL